MSKRKGVSAEEKRKRMLDIFYEKKEVFQLKELERIAPKEKGIVSQSVKDVVQSLVDDGLVDSEKIGTSIYFWAFPSKTVNNRKRKLDELKNEVNESRKKSKTLDERIKDAQRGREDTEHRRKLLKELAETQDIIRDLKAEIQKYKEHNPLVLDQMRKQICFYKDAADRWTSNIFAIKSWCKDKFIVDESTLNKQFDIPEDLDYVD